MFDIADDPFFAPRRPLGAHLLGALGRLGDRILRRLDAAADRRMFHGLSDHMLRDIGLERDQLDDALAGRLTDASS